MARLANSGDPAGEDFGTGPGIGEVVPAFALPDQRGRRVSYEGGGRRALILFYRSASW